MLPEMWITAHLLTREKRQRMAKIETTEYLLRPGKREPGKGYHLAPLLGKLLLAGVGLVLLFVFVLYVLFFSGV